MFRIVDHEQGFELYHSILSKVECWSDANMVLEKQWDYLKIYLHSLSNF